LFFLNRFAEQNRREMRHVNTESMRLLYKYDWPGNIRELQNYVERAVILGTGSELMVEHLPPQLRGQTVPRLIQPRSRGSDLITLCAELVRQGISTAGPSANDLHSRIVGEVERELIQQVLQTCDRVQIKAALRLGINRNTLHKKLSEYRLDHTDPGVVADIPRPSGSSRRNGNTADQDHDKDSGDYSQPAEPALPIDED
jgi:two-component system, NtrC family, response regulator AtoC